MSEEVFFSFTLLVALGAVGYYFYLQKKKLDTLEKEVEVIFEEELRPPRPEAQKPNPWRDYFTRYGTTRAYPMYDRVQRIVDLTARGDKIHREDMLFLKKIDQYINDYGQDHVVDESRRDEIEKYLQQRERDEARQKTQRDIDDQMKKEMKRLMQLEQERKQAEKEAKPQRDIDDQMEKEMKRPMQLEQQRKNSPPVITGHSRSPDTQEEDPVKKEIRELLEAREKRRQDRYREREDSESMAGPGVLYSAYDYLSTLVHDEEEEELRQLEERYKKVGESTRVDRTDSQCCNSYSIFVTSYSYSYFTKNVTSYRYKLQSAKSN